MQSLNTVFQVADIKLNLRNTTRSHQCNFRFMLITSEVKRFSFWSLKSSSMHYHCTTFVHFLIGIFVFSYLYRFPFRGGQDLLQIRVVSCRQLLDANSFQVIIFSCLQSLRFKHYCYICHFLAYMVCTFVQSSRKLNLL